MSVEPFIDEPKKTHSADHLRAVLETTPECVKLVSKDGTLIQMNPSGLSIVGASCSEEVVGKNVFNLISPQYREMWIAHHNRVCSGESLIWQFEVTGLKGEKRFLETHAVPFGLPNNEIAHLAVTRDISLQKQMEDDLKTSAEQLKAIFQSVHDGILVQDAEFRTVYANETAAKMLGFNSAEEFKGIFDTEIAKRFSFWDESDKPICVNEFPARKVFAGEEFAEATYRVHSHRSGNEYWSKISSRAIRDPSKKVIFAVSIFRDVTNEKRSQLESKFLNEVSHVLASNLDFKQIIESLSLLVIPNLADWFAIELLDSAGNLQQVQIASKGSKENPAALEMRRKFPVNIAAQSMTADVLRTGEPYLVENTQGDHRKSSEIDDEYWSFLKQLNIHSNAIIPLKSRNKIIGVIHLGSSETKKKLTRTSLSFLTEFGLRAGLAIDNAKLFERTRVSEERLELALTGSGIGLWEWSIKEDKLYFSARCLEIFGARPENFQSNFHEDFQRFIHPDDRERVNKAVRESVSAQSHYSIEYRTVREIDGKIGWVQAQGKTYYDETKNPLRMVGTVIDITERKEVEDLLRLRARVLESMNEGVSLSNEDGQIVYTNPAEDKLFGYEPGELIGKHVSIQNAYDEKTNIQRVTAVIEELKKSGIWSGEWHNRRKDGSTFFTKAHITSLDLGNKPHWVCVQEDITLAKNASEALQKSKEEAIRASQAKSIFLANMSHEIRTPMNAILGFATILGDPNLSQSEREEYSRRAQANGNHLLHLIDDILDLSKVEAGQMQLSIGDLRLRHFANELHNELKVLVSNKKIQTQIEISDELPDLIRSDEVRFKQVLNNLIGNAAKFTETGFIHLRFKPSSDKRELIIEVEDNGIGIPLETQAHLFKTFSQADNSVTRKYGGTGLGLQLSRKICEALGGGLTLVRSDRNQGALFRVVLPLITSKSSISDKPIINHSLHGLPKNLKILLAEDSPDNQILIKVFLGGSNPNLTIVENGKEAVSQASQKEFDVILMDIQMPEMDGLEAARKIRSKNPKVPILALTAHALPEEVERSLRAGCNAHLTKPLSKPDLIATINRFI